MTLVTSVKSTADLPLDKSAPSIRRMFGRIAPRYDLLNHLLSAGQDIWWRARAAKRLDPKPGERILDLGSGTGDLAVALSRRGRGARITAADFTFEMLAIGKGKVGAAPSPIVQAQADAMKLPFSPASFDAAAAAFSVRNFEGLEAGLREVWRILKPGGRFLILEFAPEPVGIMKPFILAYCRLVLPVVGRLVSGEQGAYTYLPDSVRRWPAPKALAETLQRSGFAKVDVVPLSFGVAVMHLARKGAA
ncbi:MAG TPA: ubiquinone/menaquinone biosynthesis methyltransferase [Thermoanaerobaculia bacterium]|nr:ubiquinone/menaquinone biosynthesis methyltransferase [Thermoanaerobaculia bacterium]